MGPVMKSRPITMEYTLHMEPIRNCALQPLLSLCSTIDIKVKGRIRSNIYVEHQPKAKTCVKSSDKVDLSNQPIEKKTHLQFKVKLFENNKATAIAQ